MGHRLAVANHKRTHSLIFLPRSHPACSKILGHQLDDF